MTTSADTTDSGKADRWSEKLRRHTARGTGVTAEEYIEIANLLESLATQVAADRCAMLEAEGAIVATLQRVPSIVIHNHGLACLGLALTSLRRRFYR